jgi:hypothetical protein
MTCMYMFVLCMYLSCARMQVVTEMVEAIINRDNLLELGLPCHHARQTHGIRFNMVIQNAKKAAGLFIVIHCLCIALF